MVSKGLWESVRPHTTVAAPIKEAASSPAANPGKGARVSANQDQAAPSAAKPADHAVPAPVLSAARARLQREASEAKGTEDLVLELKLAKEAKQVSAPKEVLALKLLRTNRQVPLSDQIPTADQLEMVTVLERKETVTTAMDSPHKEALALDSLGHLLDPRADRTQGSEPTVETVASQLRPTRSNPRPRGEPTISATTVANSASQEVSAAPLQATPTLVPRLDPTASARPTNSAVPLTITRS